MTDQPLLRPEQVAARLDISVDQVYRLLKRGTLKSYRVGLRGGRYRIGVTQIVAYLESCETRAAVAPEITTRPATRKGGKYISRHFGPL